MTWSQTYCSAAEGRKTAHLRKPKQRKMKRSPLIASLVLTTRLAGAFLLLLAAAISLTGCGSGSNAEGIVTDFFQDTPISGAKVLADTKTDIAEEKRSAHVVSATNSKGKFCLHNMLPERYYEVSIIAPGYISTLSSVTSPSKKQTKLIDKRIKLVKVPPQNGFFIFSSGQFSQLSPFTKIHREREILYTGMAVARPSIRYVLEPDISEQSIPKVKSGSYLIIYGKDSAFFSNEANMYRGGYVFPWYIHTLKKFPTRTYQGIAYKGNSGSPTPVTIPESYYCGLLSVNANLEWGGHHYEDSVVDVQDIAGTSDQFCVVYRINLRPGKYFISNFHNKSYVSSTDYSEQKVVGYLFEVI